MNKLDKIKIYKKHIRKNRSGVLGFDNIDFKRVKREFVDNSNIIENIFVRKKLILNVINSVFWFSLLKHKMFITSNENIVDNRIIIDKKMLTKLLKKNIDA